MPFLEIRKSLRDVQLPGWPFSGRVMLVSVDWVAKINKQKYAIDDFMCDIFYVCDFGLE